MRTIIEKETLFYISFDFDRKITAAAKKLPNAEYNTKYKRWEVSINHQEEVFNFGQNFGFSLPDGKSIRNVFSVPMELPVLTQKIDLLLKPYAYQEPAIAYGIEKGSCINGDAPGCGKTMEALATVIALGLFPCLIIPPANLKDNWEEEVALWTDKHKALILTNSTKHTWNVFNQMGMYDIFIVNYESLSKYFVVKLNKDRRNWTVKDIDFHPNIKIFKSVIVDESHRIKDPSTIQSKLTYGICTQPTVEFVNALSGTPIINRPIDLLPQLAITNNLRHFGTIKNFREMCADNERWPEINSILRANCYFRREKKDVLDDLPELARQKIFCSITNQPEYDAAMADLETYLRDWKQASSSQIAKSMKGKVMVQIGVLKNISARGKIADACQYIDDILDSGEKIVVFIYLHEVADELKKRYPKALFYTGKQTDKEKVKAKHDFQKCTVCDKKFERHEGSDHEFVPSEHQLMFISYKSGGVGITLTAASICAHLELPWTAADVEQDESREHRNSQKNAVQSAFFIGRNTIDEQHYQAILDKREMSSACTGAIDDAEETTYNSIINLLNK